MGFRLEGRTVLITGASDGIGRSMAEELDGRAARLLLVARGEEALDRTARRLEVESRVIPCDLSHPDGPDTLLAAIADEKIDLLINNAGVGLGGPFAGQDLDAVFAMCRLNIDAPLRLVHGLLPKWLERGDGAVLNVGSMAGYVGCPGQGVYGATKSFINFWSDALRSELHGTGVQVTLLAPGSTRTGFFERAGIDATKLKKSFQDATAVARAGLAAVERGQSIRIPGLPNKLMELGVRFAPRALVRAAARKVFKPLITGK